MSNVIATAKQLLDNIEAIPGYAENEDGDIVIRINRHKGGVRYVSVEFETVERILLSGADISRVRRRKVAKDDIDRLLGKG